MGIHYEKLMPLFKDYNDTFNALYQLKTNREEELNEIVDKIKIHLINTKLFSPSNICMSLFTVMIFRNRYLKSYWTIFKKFMRNTIQFLLLKLLLSFNILFSKSMVRFYITKAKKNSKTLKQVIIH